MAPRNLCFKKCLDWRTRGHGFLNFFKSGLTLTTPQSELSTYACSKEIIGVFYKDYMANYMDYRATFKNDRINLRIIGVMFQDYMCKFKEYIYS